MSTQQRNDLTKKRVLWIIPIILDVDLYKESVLEILRKLTNRGHTTRLIAMRSNDFRFKDPRVNIDAIPIKYMPVVSNGFFMLSVFLLLPLYIAIYKPNFVVVTPDASIFGVIPHFFILKLRKIRLILDVRSNPVETMGFRGALQKLCFSTSILVSRKIFDGITTITPVMKKQLCSQFSIDGKQLGVWPVGVSTVLFDPNRFINQSTDMKTKLGLSSKFLILYHGSFAPTRGLVEVIEAIKMLKTKHPDIVFLLLGNGSIASKLRELIQDEGLKNNVIIHDSVDQNEVPEFISACDVGIVPLPNHPFWRAQCPLKLLEYLAMGKVVLATDIPAHRLVMGKTQCGVYITSINPECIAESIDFVYQRKEKLEEWGRKGRTIIQNNYTWEKVAEELESYLLSVENKAD